MLSILALGLLVGPRGWTAPALPTAIPDSDLVLDPHRHVGLVRTDSSGPDPAVFGSGWVAGERVVVSAAHVFFIDDTLGWSRNRWYWRRAAPANGDWDTNSMMIPRAYRVLAGYAAAAKRAGGDDSKNLDVFNVDQLALLFYRPTTDLPPPPRASEALLGTGTYSILGYPATLLDEPVPVIQMYGHVGGRAATFTRIGEATDYAGNPNLMALTGDLTIGPGASGGPVFKRTGDTWTVVGSVLGGNLASTAVVVRAVDASLEAMIAVAISDSIAEGPGLALWERIGASLQDVPVFRRDGSVLVTMSPTDLSAIDARGDELWRHTVKGLPISWVAEAPDGRVLVSDNHTVIALDGMTGTELWRIDRFQSARGAVGQSGEVYLPVMNGMMRVSSRGTVDWDITYPSEQSRSADSGAPVIGPDNTVSFILHDRLRAVRPTDGSERWRTPPIADVHSSSLAVGPDGSLTLASFAGISRYDSDGSPRWFYATNLYGSARFVVRGDGSVVMAKAFGAGALIIGPGGTLMEDIPLQGYVESIDIDSAGNLYVVRRDGIEAISAARASLWKTTSWVRRLTIGPGGVMIAQLESPTRTVAIGQNAAGASDLWRAPTGGYDGARRVANAAGVPPRIVAQPRSARSVLGYRLELSVTADGSTGLTYEWRKDGRLLPGQVGPRLIIRQSAASDAGNYTVTVRNGVGSIMSEPARIEVGEARFGESVWATDLVSLAAPAVADDGTVYAVVMLPNPIEPSKSVATLVAVDASGNEKWRRELARAGYMSVWATSPIVGDDGRIYAATPGKISAFSMSGDLLWTHTWPAARESSRLMMSLARDGGVFVGDEGVVKRLSADGQVLWTRSDVSRMVGFQVRRDGGLVVGPLAVVSAGGVLWASDIAPTGSQFGFIGPRDEWVVDTGRGGVVTLDSTGEVISRNPQVSYELPMLMLSNGMFLTDRMRLEPLMGRGSSARWIPGARGAEPMAVLDGDRLLIREGSLVRVIDTTGTVLAGPTTLRGGAFTVSSRGILVGGDRLAAYSAGWPVSRSPWPLFAADARNTRRAPVQFDERTGLPSSVKIQGCVDPAGLFGSAGFLRDGPLEVHIGYPARLSAAVFGAGPFSYRWTKDGLDLAGAKVGELDFASVGLADAGAYRVSVTNSAGTVLSDAITVNVRPPEAATPGLYTGTWSQPSLGTAAPCVYRVDPDRRLQVWLFGSGNMFGYVPLQPDGSFRKGGSGQEFGGTLIGSTLTLDASPLTPLDVPATGRAPNGLPAGVYLGYTLGPVVRWVTMLVLADGSFHWMSSESQGFSRTASGGFAAESLTSTLTYKTHTETVTFALSAHADGAVVGRPLAGGAAEGFFAVWTERPDVERLVNLSTRGYVGSGQPPMIAGFVVGGSGAHPLLLRVAGPALQSLGVEEALQRPRLRLLDSGGAELSRNAGWTSDSRSAEVAAAVARLMAFPFADHSADAALLALAGPGLFTALVESVDGGSGTALAEVYEDVDAAGGSGRLLNLSTRGTVGQGERVLIGGFVVAGRVPKPLLIRAAGPALHRFVKGAFAVAGHPRIRVYRQGSDAPLAENDNVVFRRNEPEVMSAAERVGAFPFPQGSLDAALVLALEPGAYTAVVDNLAAESGVALIEVYEIPAR